MKRLSLLFAFIAMMLVACTESGIDGGNKEPDNPPIPQKPSISIKTGTSLNFDDTGGNGTISFTTNEAWSAEVINSRADSWVSIHPTSGAAGSAEITVTTEPNDTPDDRSATIKIKAGSTEKSVKVSQKQKDALTVTTNSFEIGAEGGEVVIEVKANINFEYEIDESAKEWVIYEGTRAMRTSTLTFAVAKNDNAEKREAKINITSGEFNEVITIYQSGADPTIIISQYEYVVSAAGETIAVEVASDVDVVVELPADAYWVTENTTRGISTNTYYFDIAPNEEYEQRIAEIKFVNADKCITESVAVIQMQKDAIVVAKENYSVPSESNHIEISSEPNSDFDIEIDCDWIRIVDTRASTENTFVFEIDENTTNYYREGSITFTSKDDSISQKTSVTQAPDPTKQIPDNQIWYTSTTAVTPYNTDAFGTTIVSNKWDSTTGKGVITFNEGVASIGDEAFSECDNLTSVTIPNSVTTIGNKAFYRCIRLTSVTIPNSVTSIGDSAFTGCTSLTSVTIPNSVTSIGNKAFGSTGLTSVTIPNSVTSIGNGAFGQCSVLTSVTIPDSVTSIGDGVFHNCHNLTSITIPNSVTSIGEGAFYRCDNLVNVTIPDSVTAIGDYAFYWCISLTSVTIPDSVTSIGDCAFSNCYSLTAFLGKYASSDNRCLIVDGVLNSFASAGLTTYTIPDNVISIGEYTFNQCKSLTSVTIPDSVTSIGTAAFANCTNLTSVTIPNNVVSIEVNAFLYCTSLTSITIPNSVSSIGNGAFNGCTSLTSVYCKPTIPPALGTYAFYENASSRKIYVPTESVDVYKTADEWSSYISDIKGYDF